MELLFHNYNNSNNIEIRNSDVCACDRSCCADSKKKLFEKCEVNTSACDPYFIFIVTAIDDSARRRWITWSPIFWDKSAIVFNESQQVEFVNPMKITGIIAIVSSHRQKMLTGKFCLI